MSFVGESALAPIYVFISSSYELPKTATTHF